MRHRLLILGLEHEAGPSCLAQAYSRGIEVVAGGTEAQLATLATDVGDLMPVRTCIMDYRDVQRSLVAAQRLHAQSPLTGVYTYREFALESAAGIAEQLGLKGNPRSVVQVTRNKALLRQRLRAAGLPQPENHWCASLREVLEAYRRLEEPRAIIKPCSMSGSVGVRFVSNEDEVYRAAEDIFRLDDPHGILIEQLIEGPEFSVEGMVDEGAVHIFAITLKELFPDGAFVERGHLQPAPLSRATTAAIHDAASRALRAAGVGVGHFHVEVFQTRHGPIVGEIHTRVGGDWIDMLTEQVLGIEIYGLAFDQLLGMPTDFTEMRPRGAAGVRFLRVASGNVVSISGIDLAAAVDGVVHIDVSVAPGMHIAPFESSYDRVGSCLVRGGDVREVLHRLDMVEERIKIQVTPSARVARR